MLETFLRHQQPAAPWLGPFCSPMHVARSRGSLKASHHHVLCGRISTPVLLLMLPVAGANGF